MFSNQAAELSVNRPVAAVDAVRGDRVNSKFLAGTSSVRESEDNHLLLLRFHTDANQLGIDARLSHPTGPVGCIRTSPADPSYVLTTAENNPSEATLWKIPPESIDSVPADLDSDGGDDNDHDGYNYGHDESPSANYGGAGSDGASAMEERAVLRGSASSGASARLTDLAWRGAAWDDGDPSTESTMGDVATLCSDGTLTQWDVAFGSAESTRSCAADLSSPLRPGLPPRMAWDPHHPDLTAVSSGEAVTLVDWREPPSAPSLGSSGRPHHRYGITDLDFNPNKPNLLVTSGRDGLLKFWDLRNTGSGFFDADSGGGQEIVAGGSAGRTKKQRPLLVARGGHRHWATRVRYNPFHDQLVLSAGTDSLVNLWRMSTISSAPLLTFDDGSAEDGESLPQGQHQNQHQNTQEGPNVRVSRYEHMDSIHALAWGASDAWIYLSASYDGKVVLNHVPSKEKYKILL
ncbi:unnamed protein product [Pseudo-nitzschia multistriata]|uniref:Histone-binding protein RBBP4 N-terminal domain-containing protein n=1 Tax=Pseudo-nitzschia multistriata TaxID=183589 RepID=A0A448Z1X2_9STRA|nr:unnamed protein product [Pseudo-nitzschia multistriata]